MVKTGPLTQYDLEKIAQLLRPSRAVMLGLAGLAAGTAGGAYQASQPYKGDKDVSNWQMYKTRREMNRVLKALENKDPSTADVPVSTGLHRVAVKAPDLHEPALKYLDFVATPFAIPERGQAQLMTHRQKGTNLHVHRHRKNWFVHKDKFPSITMEAARVLPDKNMQISEKVQALYDGMKHLVLEGIPGAYGYVKKTITGSPEMEEIQKMPREARDFLFEMNKQSAVGPIREGNSTVPMVIRELNGTVKTALHVEVVETQGNAIKGLSHVEELPENYGMLFKSAAGFWMPGVRFDLDIVFMNKYGMVVETQRMNRQQPMKIYKPKTAAAELSLEVPAGWCEQYDINVGDRLVVPEYANRETD